ncbi:MAG: hypothetical protein QOC66_1997, partial [Pseudonocardiales bacterium]|nr:hypothetical protein [Pseudonocardiales bacterium]
RRMVDLQVVEPGDAIEAPKQITETARSTQAPEVAEQRLVALPKPRVPVGQGDLLTGVAEPEHRATS